MTFDRTVQRNTGAATTASTTAAAGPGKRTLVELLPPVPPASAVAPVQRAGAIPGTASGGEHSDVHAAAAHGTSGASTALPHMTTIQRAFGHHDVRQISAHVGGQAAEGAAAMGATAFATGQRVAFASQPDLHTAAHEAAHVVQQRAGVQLKGGVGQVGDPYEQHADAVADRVVRGESAVDLLDRMGPATAGAASGAAGPVQRLAYGEVKQENYQQAIFERKAEEFEMKLGYALSQHPQSLEGATLLTDKLKLVLESSAKGKQVDLTDTATGKVPADRTQEIFSEGNVRERMAAIYSAIRTGLGGAIAETAESPDAGVSGIVNADKVKEEKAASPSWRGFDRSNKISGAENDRTAPPAKDRSKNMDRFFKGPDAPTANKVKARGEAPLTTRELEAIFPTETGQVQHADGTWNTLSEDVRQARYLERVGDLPLSKGGSATWVGGEHTYQPGPQLKAEGKRKDMRMLAGFSGSTDMYLHLADYFGLGVADKEKVRLAALGTMLPARDHSFHEVMVASKEYGLDYTDGPQGAGYGPFRPFADANALKQLTGVAMLPNDYLKDATKQRITTETATPGHVLTARVPTRDQLPKPSVKSNLLFTSRSSYQGILGLVDRYHAAAPADRFGIADGIVGAIDEWLISHPVGGDPADEAKRAPLVDLRARALQAGTSALADRDGDAAHAKLTSYPDDREPVGGEGVLAMHGGIASGLTGAGAAAIEQLAKAAEQAAARAKAPGAPAIVPDALPAPRDAAIFTELQRSAAFTNLIAAVEAPRALRLLAFVITSKAHGVLVKYSDADADIADLGKENVVLEKVKSNYVEGVDITAEDVTHPRTGKFKLPGGAGGMRAAMQAGRGLEPDELDAVYGYTNVEYKKFNDGTIDATKRAALISAIAKLPKVPAPLYRGDYSATNDPTYARVGRVKNSNSFTSTSRSLEDSFISARTTAHVYVSSRGAADVEGFSKKTWEREALFAPGATFKCVAVVDKKRPDATKDLDATFNPATHTLDGANGLPTSGDQNRLGARRAPLELKVGFEAGDDAHNSIVAKWYENKFSDKVWMFWEEV